MNPMTATLSPTVPAGGVVSPAAEARTQRRLGSLDTMRGVTIAAMVVVNNPPIGPPYLYAQLQHAAWNGATFADTIFPAFLFMAGVSLAFAPPTGLRLVRRVVVLFALGLIVNAAPLVLAHGGLGHGHLGQLRTMGVLQRIALAYLIAALIVRVVPSRAQLAVGALILLGCWAALVWVRVPGVGAGHLTPSGNLEGFIDRRVLGPAHMYRAGAVGYDPEGLAGSIPAAVTVILGCAAGRVLHARRPRAGAVLVAAGMGSLLTGLAWAQMLPINKRMWTGSYVLFMGGLSLILLGALHLVFDRPNRAARLVSAPWRALGANPIIVYVGTELTGIALSSFHHVLNGHPAALNTWIWMTWLQPSFGTRPATVVYAAAVLGAWWLIAAFLYHFRWFVRA